VSSDTRGVREGMTDRSFKRPWLAVLIAAIMAVTLVAAGCGDDDDDDGGGGDQAAETGGEGGGGPIKIGILSDCEGAFGAFFEPDIAGAHVPLINRGAKAVNSKKPSDGIEGAEVAGRPIEIVGYGCADDTADKAIEETRRLMEQEDADILVGPLSGDEGIAVANYAKEHPDQTFVNGTSGAQDTTLKVQAPNFFRYHTDGAQWSAGLGDYAYNELGWRTAAIVGDDYSFPYTSLAGFVAEFCAVGGEVTDRVWPPLGEKDYSSFISQIPDDVDGLYVGIGGSGLISFLKQYEQQKGKLDPKKVMGNVFFDDPLVLKEVGPRLVGAVTSGPTAADSTEPSAESYVKEIEAVYPEIAPLAASVFVYNYYTAMEALLQGLEQVDGDISGGQKALQDALVEIQLDAAYSQVELDQNRQGIADNYVKRIVADKTGDKVPDVETFRRIPAVDQTFGGFFSPETPAPDRENPTCEKRDPPSWVGKAEQVNFGGGN
jgi:branched-chain amino acid transport system substrate-binding protein